MGAPLLFFSFSPLFFFSSCPLLFSPIMFCPFYSPSAILLSALFSYPLVSPKTLFHSLLSSPPYSSPFIQSSPLFFSLLVSFSVFPPLLFPFHSTSLLSFFPLPSSTPLPYFPSLSCLLFFSSFLSSLLPFACLPLSSLCSPPLHSIPLSATLHQCVFRVQMAG